jgi:hypothetical protein
MRERVITGPPVRSVRRFSGCDAEALSSVPLVERRSRLASIVPEGPGMICTTAQTNLREVAEKLLGDARALHLEGGAGEGNYKDNVRAPLAAQR